MTSKAPAIYCRAIVDQFVRLTTAFNRILRLSGATVQSAAFTEQGLVIALRRRRRRLVCPCGASTMARYDSSRRRWRHLDFGACQVWLEADIHRINCRSCSRVRTEQVPWAGRTPGTPLTSRTSPRGWRSAFEEFFAALGRERAAAVEAISLDGSSVYLPVTHEQIPQARICLDPFHVIKWTNEVVDRSTGPKHPPCPPAPACLSAATGAALVSPYAPA